MSKIKFDKTTVIVLVVSAVILAVGFATWGGDKTEPASPASAEGMTAEERASFDTEALANLISAEYTDLRIDYRNSQIKLYVDYASDEQYVADKADDYIAEISDILSNNRAELTFEKSSYNVMIYGNDGNLIKMQVIAP